MSHPVTLRILVCGDADRGDNGAPLIAIGRLLPSLPRAVLDQVEVRRREQLDIADLLDLAAGEACVLVDTAAGVEPGEIVTVALADLACHARDESPRSLHVIPIAEALTSVVAARGAVPAGSFVGIGGRSFGFGVPLSIPVRNALPDFATAIGTEITRLLGVAVPDAP